MLWPELDASRARADLRRTLSVLNRELGGAAILADRETARLNPDLDLWLDVDAFRQQLVEATKHEHLATEVCPDCLPLLEEVVALYRDDFLAGFTLDDSAAFDEWQFFETESLRDALSGALARLVAWYEEQGERAFEQAITYTRRWLTLDPLHEPAHRHLMTLYAQSGQRSAALRQYRECVRVLDEELGVAPTEETSALFERIRGGELAATADVALTEAGDQVAQTPTSASVMLAGPEGERRTVTVLLVDVCGANELLAATDLETWTLVMNPIIEKLASEARRFGGQIDQRRGDGLVATFGAAAAHEDDPERAILAALAMQQAFATYIEGLANDETGPPDVDIVELACSSNLCLRVGVNTGAAIAFPGSEETGQAQKLSTEALIVAERVQATMPPGIVWVSEAAYRLVAPLFDWASLDEDTLPGTPLHHPITHKGLVDKGRGIAGLSSPLVGRKTEFRALQDTLDRLNAGIGGIVTLVGEAGIGKSRLVAELKSKVKSPKSKVAGQTTDFGPSTLDFELNWIEGRCLSYTTDVAYQLWLDMLRGLFDVTPDANPTDVRDALQRWVRALCPGSFDAVYPFLGRLLALSLDESWTRKLDRMVPGERQVSTFRAVATAVESAARQRPLVIVCEDLHWADPTSLDLLAHLLPLTDRVPVLFLCVLRPETEHGCWRIKEIAGRDFAHRHTDLWLQPLSPEASTTLVGNLLTVEDLPQSLRDQVLAHAEGNPFFVEEILRALIDDGVVTYDDQTGHWQAVRDDIAMPVPDTVHGILAARIDRLPVGARQVLQLASVVGRIFTQRLLAALIGDTDLSTHLVTLLRTQMIRERAQVDDRTYIFKHQLLLEAAYASLLRRKRRILHRRVAEMLERLYPQRVEEQLGVLARHWEQAGDVERAVDYLKRAGEQAMSQYANLEAVDYFSRALALLPEADITEQNMSQILTRYKLLLARERLYHYQTMRVPQEKDLKALATLAEALDAAHPLPGFSRQAEVIQQWLEYASRTGIFENFSTAAQEAISLARARQDKIHEAQGYRQSGAYLSYVQADYDMGQQHLERAITLAQEIEAYHVEATSLRWLGAFKLRQLNPTAAWAYLEKALHIAQKVGYRWIEAEVLLWLGYASFTQSKYNTAKNYYEQALRLYNTIGARDGQAFVTGRYFGEFFLAQEDYPKTRTYMDRALQIATVMNDPSGKGYYLYSAGYALRVQGYPIKPKEYYKQALHVFREAGDQQGEFLCYFGCGMADFDLGNYTEAQQYFESGLRFSRKHQYLQTEYMFLLGFSLILHCQHADEDAHQHAQQVLRITPRVFAWYYTFPMVPSLILGHALTGLGEFSQATDAYQQALDVYRMTGWPSLPMEPLAGLARVALAQGDLPQAQAHVETILEHLKTRTLNGTLEPFRIYLTCVRVLEAAGDPRAQSVLQTAYHLLQERASYIDDEALKRSFLHNVAAHRELVAAYEKQKPHAAR